MSDLRKTVAEAMLREGWRSDGNERLLAQADAAMRVLAEAQRTHIDGFTEDTIWNVKIARFWAEQGIPPPEERIPMTRQDDLEEPARAIAVVENHEHCAGVGWLDPRPIDLGWEQYIGAARACQRASPLLRHAMNILDHILGEVDGREYKPTSHDDIRRTLARYKALMEDGNDPTA